MAKKTKAERKEANIKAETQRRIDAGDTSSYVQKSAKKHGLKVPTRTTYNPNKVSHAIKETTGLSGKDAWRANQAFRAQDENNKRIQEQNARRRRVEEAFARNGSVSKGDFTGNMGDGIFGLNTGRATPTGRPKLREGLTSNEYGDWMRKLYKVNPSMMEQIFPWGSGKTARGIMKLATPAPLKMIGKLAKDALTAGGKGIATVFPGMTQDLSFEYDKFKKNFENIGPNIKGNVKSMLGLTPTEEANLNILNKEMNSDQKDIHGVLEAQNDDWTESILGDVIDEAETQSIDDIETKLAYDPRVKDEIYDENVDPNYWSHGYTQKFQGQPGFDEEYEEIRDERADKLAYIKQATGIDASGPNMINNLDQLYEMTRSKEDEGQVWDQPSGTWQAKPTAGEIDLSAQEDLFNVGGNQDQIDEVREQIDWNTANQPLGTSYWEPPELTEDFIKDNIITGSEGWDFNQGGYLKKYDDGGYANMSTFEKLKAINDSIAEG